MRKIYILPNLFTAGSLFAGMLAIFSILNGQPQQACWLILLSSVLDVADGAIARLTHSMSSFGLHLDSLADLVAFGVAPALLAYEAFDPGQGEGLARMSATVCSLYVVCGALRLARFNVQSQREERKSFLGLPIPGAALAATSMVWVLSMNPTLLNHELLMRIGPPAMVILAYLMVSKVIYFGFKQISLADRQPFEILVMFVFVVWILYLLKHNIDIVLMTGSWLYVTVGVLYSLVRSRRLSERIARRREAHALRAGSRND